MSQQVEHGQLFARDSEAPQIAPTGPLLEQLVQKGNWPVRRSHPFGDSLDVVGDQLVKARAPVAMLTVGDGPGFGDLHGLMGAHA